MTRSMGQEAGTKTPVYFKLLLLSARDVSSIICSTTFTCLRSGLQAALKRHRVTV